MSKTNLEYNCNIFPSYGDLPMEIILQIYRYLGYADLQAAAATCSRWRAALDDKEFISQICVRFSDKTGSVREMPKWQLNYRHFHFEDVSHVQLEAFTAYIGAAAQSVSLDNVELSDKQLYGIMSNLPQLRELSISRCSSLFMSGTFLNATKNNKAFAINLANIKKLALRDCQYLTDAILVRLTQHMPALESLNLSGCPIAFHNAIYKRFYPTNDANNVHQPSESVLTFEYIQRVLDKQQNHIQELSFSYTLIGKKLLTLCNFQLQRLYLAGCRQLIDSDLIKFLRSQPRLVVLDLTATTSLTNACLECIVQTTPLLEELKISGCLSITNAGAVYLGDLHRLRHLDISGCDGITTDGLINGIAHEKNTVLQELNISYLQICEECIKCIARNLSQLRILDVSHCVDGVTDEAVQCIIQHLRWLRELHLDSCVRLTDASLTGINLARLMIHNSNSQKSSIENFYPPLTYSLAERESLASSQQSVKISLRSKAEEEIVRDAKRKQAMFAAYEMNLIGENDIEGFNIQELRGLRTLSLRGCNKISDVSLKYGIKLLELRSLLLSNCQQISLRGMESLVQYCPSIEELDLSDCYNINDKTIQVVTSKLRRLRFLNISGCSQLTDHSLDAIIVNCKHLQTLSVYRCRSMYTDIEERLSYITTLRNIHMDSVASIDFHRLKKRLDY